MQHHKTYHIGAKVRVTRGKLAGITGILIETKNSGNCVLSIDFWANGVLIVVSGRDLEQVED